MINWTLRTYQAIQGQCAVKQEGTGTDGGTEWRCGGVQLLLKEKCEQKSGTHISL